MSKSIDIIIEPSSERFDPNDDRWIDQVNDLYSDCKTEVGEIRKNITPVEGAKGGFEEIILAISSSPAIEMAFDLFKSWILRDKTRNLKLKIKNGEEVTEIELSGNGFKKEEMEKYMLLAIKLQSEKNE